MEKSALLNHVVNNFLEHVIVLDMNKQMVYQTTNVSSLLGFNTEEIIELGINQLFVNSNFNLNEALSKAKKYGEFISTENLKHKTKDFINVAYRLYYQESDTVNEPVYIFLFKR